jgi:hypothetical protein
MLMTTPLPSWRKLVVLWALRALPLFLLLSSLNVQANDCENVIKMDGLFSKAHRECPFSYYAFRFHQQSQMCGEKTGETKWKQLFSQGASTFDSKAASMGKSALCAKLVKVFPMTVKF